ncbi:MAG: beta-ACP synthase [Alistipes sp.]|jgi:3-oxoacyl-(acyl-carrier-protein) synthase|nr:beta-ACP synthase [Alistipes sp.]
MTPTPQNSVWLGPDSIITALGSSSAEVVSAISAGRVGCREVRDSGLWGEPFVAGRVEREKIPAGRPGETPLEAMFIATIGDVVARSDIDPGASDSALIVSSTKGNIDLLTGEVPVDERVFIGEMAVRIADRCGFANRPIVISNACISGVSAIIVASRLIREGMYRNVVVAGGDVLTRFVVTGFQAFRSVSGKVCRPYDAARDGLTLGEGCGAVLLTADRERATHPAVEVAGGAVSGDANHISGPSRTGDGLFFALRDAMAEADVVPAEVGFVNGHGTGTLFNDEMESKAFALAGLDNTPVDGLKPYFGHTLGAAGVIETIVSAHGLRSDTIFGTPGFSEAGTPHALSVSPAHRATGADVCIKTASGFGGCNAAVVLRRVEGSASSPPQAAKDGRAAETARILITPTPPHTFAETIRERFKALSHPDMKFFKMDDLSKLAYVAAGELLARARQNGTDVNRKYSPDRIGIVLANRSASLDTDLRHCRRIATDYEASPAVFVYTLPNVSAGEVAIRHKIQGENTFFIDNDARFATLYARMLLSRGHLDAVICGWCELLGENYKAELMLLEKQ